MKRGNEYLNSFPLFILHPHHCIH